MQLDHLFYQREAYSCAVCSSTFHGVCLMKAIENERELRRRYADAGVPDRYLRELRNPDLDFSDVNENLPTLRREFERVR